jgi:hypothetical protein
MRYFTVLVCALLMVIGCSTPAKTEARTYAMGDKAEVGPLIYTVFDTQWMPALKSGDKDRVPANRFFLVRLSVLNGGGGDTTVPPASLVDDSGQTYPELSDGEGVPEWLGYLRKIKPVDTERGNVAFDVAPKHYKLRISDDSEQHVAFVDLPLNFTGAAGVPPP